MAGPALAAAIRASTSAGASFAVLAPHVLAGVEGLDPLRRRTLGPVIVAEPVQKSLERVQIVIGGGQADGGSPRPRPSSLPRARRMAAFWILAAQPARQSRHILRARRTVSRTWCLPSRGPAARLASPPARPRSAPPGGPRSPGGSDRRRAKAAGGFRRWPRATTPRAARPELGS